MVSPIEILKFVVKKGRIEPNEIKAHYNLSLNEVHAMLEEIARKEGILVGLSSGAVVAAFKKIAKDSGVYVLVFPDMGYKYAEQLEEYMHKKLILDKE